MAISCDRVIRNLYASSAFCALVAVGLILPRPSGVPVLEAGSRPAPERSDLPELCEAFGKLARRHRQMAELIARQAPECRPALNDFRDAVRTAR
ncbi:MAG: hypothetical protein HY553_10025 [Elusimicrobia bacterium]|nr:hypothetical protein [Elusimicrobiota bacterium]